VWNIGPLQVLCEILGHYRVLCEIVGHYRCCGEYWYVTGVEGNIFRGSDSRMEKITNW
jgi:hypothetical protein